MSNNKKIIALSVLAVVLLGASVALAQAPLKLSYAFPCTTIAGGSCPSAEEAASCPAAYITRFYQFALGIAGFLAFAMIIFGAVQYIFSAGNTAAQSDARDRIFQALFGVALLMGAYLILYTIDPALVALKCTSLQQVIVPPVNATSTIISTAQPSVPPTLSTPISAQPQIPPTLTTPTTLTPIFQPWVPITSPLIP